MKKLSQWMLLTMMITTLACSKKDDSSSVRTAAAPKPAANSPNSSLPALDTHNTRGTLAIDDSTSNANNKKPKRHKDFLKFAVSEASKIRKQLETKFDAQPDSAMKDRSIALAESIEDVRISVMRDTSIAEVSVILKDNKNLQRFDLSGKMDLDGKGELRANLATLRHQVRGELRCLDKVISNCQVSILTFKKLGEAKATAQILIRKTAGTLDYTASSNQLQISEAKEIAQTFQDAVDLKFDGEAVRSMVNTFEVIKGRSIIDALIITHDHQVLGFHGPLMLPDPAATVTNVKMEKTIDETMLANFGDLGSFKHDLQNAIDDVRLIEIVANERFSVLYTFTDGSSSENLKFDLYRQSVSTKSLQ